MGQAGVQDPPCCDLSRACGGAFGGAALASAPPLGLALGQSAGLAFR